MKSRLIKGFATSLAVVMTTTAVAMPVLAAEKVTISHDTSAGTVTATRTDGASERIALAQFDNLGRLKGLNISSASSPATVTNGFNFDPNYKTKVISFSDFETATALEEARILGSKTLFVWDGENRQDSSFDSNGGAGDIDEDFSDNVGFGYDSSLEAFHAKHTESRHIHMYADSITTDWIVYSFDMTINANVAVNKDSNISVLSVELYGGKTTDPDGDGDHYERYLPIMIRRNDEGRALGSWWLSNDPQTQIAFNCGGNGSVSTSYSEATIGSTYHVTLTVNQRDRYYTMKVTVGGNTTTYTQDMSATTDEDFPIRALRFHFHNKYDITLDNMYVYEGAAPRDNISTEIIREIILNGNSILDATKYADIYNDSLYTSQLGTTKAVHANTGIVWDGSKKVVLEHTPWNNDGVQMVPVADLEAALGMTCQSTANAVTRDGVQYVPIADFLGSTAYTRLSGATHNPNCYVLKSGFSPSNVDNFNRWMLYYRPTEAQVLADYKASGLEGEHPRLLATRADFDTLKAWHDAQAADDANFNAYYDNTEVYDENGTMISGTWLGNVKANSPWNRWLRNSYTFVNKRVSAINSAVVLDNPTAEEARSADIPYYKAYDTVGRMNYQRKLASDMHILALWYQMSGDSKYAEAAWKCLSQVVDESKFPDFNLGHLLDVSEAQAAMAIAYDWLYDYWVEYDATNGTDRLKQLEDCMYRNGLYYSWNGYQESGVMANEFLATANHGTVGNNGAMMLALALMDEYPEECAYVVSQAIKCQEENIWKWNTGTWFEGAGYWELTMQHTAKFIGTLDMLFPGGYGFKGLEGLSETGVAEVQHHTPLGIYNYGDNSTSMYWVPELIWLANEYDQTDLAYYVWKNKTQGWNSDKACHGEDAALALLWMLQQEDAKTYNWATGYTPEALGLDYCNEAVDVAMMRDTHNSTTDYTYVGLKGGQATDAHAQIDAGSFIFEDNGIRWAQDPGSGSYLSGYFDTKSGGQRWKQLPARGEAHNTLIINPAKLGTAYEDQVVSARAELTGFTSNSSGAIATVDMSTVLFDVSAAKRGFFFTDNRQSLVVRDEFTPSAAGTAYWTMMLPKLGDSDSVTVSDNRITVVHNGQTLYVDYVVSGGTAETPVLTKANFQPITSTNIIDLGKTNGQIRIPVTITNGTAVGITVKLTPATATDTTAVSAYGAISSWSL